MTHEALGAVLKDKRVEDEQSNGDPIINGFPILGAPVFALLYAPRALLYSIVAAITAIPGFAIKLTEALRAKKSNEE